ncbi:MULTISPECIES: integrase domain-containing protein [Photobacterium]|uniref:integrase domain-containing protein n=1 Tax=Photobacterium TaxID=657 RepID=UPI000D15FC4D|nr:integrase domain-containing protein [Photobacterium leiognathi]PSW56840.1 integrase [Photobacterium leiognathi subsp. mandapamensis]
MARKTAPLTDKQVKNARPFEKEYILSDGQGLQLRVMPNGTKSWRLIYKNPILGKQARLTLGTYPTLSIAKARKIASDNRELVAQGIDPKQHKEDKQKEYLAIYQNTLLNVSEKWFEIKRTEVTPDHADDIWRSLNNHIFPSLRNTPISQLAAPETIKVLRTVEAKGSLETVKRVTQRLNEIMIFAVNCGLTDTNPLAGIKSAFKQPQKEHMKALTPKELPELMYAIANASIKRTTRCLIEFQLHTMTRPSEAAGAKWEEFDLKKRIWAIPAERMKKNKEHQIPLTDQVMALLDIMTPISGHREFVFPADRNPQKPTNSQTANMALKRMGFAGRLVSHGLRSIASTTLNEEGFESDLIEAALAHVGKDEVRRAYNRTDYIDRRKPMMCWWSEHIERSAQGSLSLSQTKALRVFSN